MKAIPVEQRTKQAVVAGRPENEKGTDSAEAHAADTNAGRRRRREGVLQRAAKQRYRRHLAQRQISPHERRSTMG
eukprot:3105510-Pleurochrysis_carterae.AAC.2